jgi:hypothetical protein
LWRFVEDSTEYWYKELVTSKKNWKGKRKGGKKGKISRNGEEVEESEHWLDKSYKHAG